MNEILSNKINLLKALAIALVVSGHLEFSIFGMFPPYSFQLALFFFISGLLFKEKYLKNVTEFIKKRIKSLLIPYYLYASFYMIITIIIFKLTNKFWGMELNLKNFFLTPFLNGHQLDLICPMWFVTQLFITMIAFLFIQKIFQNKNELIKIILYSILGFSAIPLSKIMAHNDINILLIRTIFSLFFVYLGHFYITKIEGKINIFTPKILAYILCLQAFLWHFNRDFNPQHGIGLSYVLVWLRFDQQMFVPILTSITGIWFSLFFIEITYEYIKDIKFLKLVGQNTYHIMANHLFIVYLITTCILKMNNIPIEIMDTKRIYWIYNPIQNTYLYFIIIMFTTTYIGVGLKFLKRIIFKK